MVIHLMKDEYAYGKGDGYGGRNNWMRQVFLMNSSTCRWEHSVVECLPSKKGGPRFSSHFQGAEKTKQQKIILHPPCLEYIKLPFFKIHSIHPNCSLPSIHSSQSPFHLPSSPGLLFSSSLQERADLPGFSTAYGITRYNKTRLDEGTQERKRVQEQAKQSKRQPHSHTVQQKS